MINLWKKLQYINSKEYDVLAVMHFATPLYGTELYSTYLENGFIKDGLAAKDFALVTQICGKPLISTKGFSSDDVINLARSFILRPYLLRYEMSP